MNQEIAIPLSIDAARLRGVTKRYGATVALDGVDLALRRGEVVALLGPNGAGKTTTVHLLLGLTRPDAGTVEVAGHEPTSLAARGAVGAMLQVAKVPAELRVREHLELASAYYDRPLPLAETIRIAGLGGLEERRYGLLSGGQQQRVMFAFAICGDPGLVLLDEPTVGLDVEARRGLWQAVRDLAARGKTVLLTTHYLEEAEALASRVVVLDRGRVVADGSPLAIQEITRARRIRCRTALSVAQVAGLAGLVGSPQAVVTGADGRVELTVADAEGALRRLLAADPALSELEVRAAGLEEAMLRLTGWSEENAA